MNIFGEGFPEEINKQIKYRQEIYGSGYNTNRTPEEISYLNSNTGWCKLISGVDISSSVDINNPNIKNLGLNSNELAKQFILFNGTADSDGKSSRAGIYQGNNLLGGNSAYGIGGTEFGINPMMGIISANIKHENKGSLRRAEVKIKAHNRVQFEIIDTLYLRLGFSVLLEWGHAITIDDKKVINFNPQFSLSDTFIKGNYTYDKILKQIYDQRLKSGGNYDAMLAKVVNFDWSFNQDGSYDITVFLTSIGDIIESLKINGLSKVELGKEVTNALSNNNDVELTVINVIANLDTLEDVIAQNISENIIDSFAFSSDIGYFLWQCKQLTSIVDDTITTKNDQGITAVSFRTDTKITKFKDEKVKWNPDIFDKNNHDVMKVIFDDLGGRIFGDDNRFYVRLGTLLRFIEQKIIPKIYNYKGKPSRLLKFDTDANTNLMMTNPYQVSVDPRICYVNRTVNIGNDEILTFGISKPKSPFINNGVTNKVGKKGIEYGNIMNIYLDTTFILNKIKELSDDKGNLSLINFLKGLMSGLNEGLGGINDFDIFVDETNNCVKIIDKNPLLYIDEVITYINDPKNTNQNVFDLYNNGKKYNQVDKNYIIQLYGYNPKSIEAGIINSFNLSSNLSPEFSTMITVGAAANGTVVGENDTALSKLNKGFIDRYKSTITNKDDSPASDIKDKQEELKSLKSELEDIKSTYINFLKLLANDKNKGSIPILLPPGLTPVFISNPVDNQIEVEEDDIDNFKSYLSTLIQKANEVDKIRDSIEGTSTTYNYQGTGFLPFSLNLTLNGLSGIKINQQFLLDTRFLPSNYPDVLKFLIKNLSHEISNNRWITKIETYAVPKPLKNKDQDKEKEKEKEKPSILFEEDTPSTNTSGLSTNTPGSSKVEIIPFTTSGLISPFLYPIDGFVTSKIGSRQGPNGDYHYGIDIGAPYTSSVYAAYSGVVTRIGANGYGPNAVYIAIDPSNYSDPNKVKNKYTCIYGHNNSAVVKKGDRVKAGDLIAYSGDLDSPGSFHLHFQIQGGTIPTGGNKPKQADIVVDLNPYFPDPRGKIKAKVPFSITKPIGLSLPGIP